MAILAAIATVAAKAGLKVVAEGIERAEQAQAVMDCGIALGQGYHFGRPVPDGELRSIFGLQG